MKLKNKILFVTLGMIGVFLLLFGIGIINFYNSIGEAFSSKYLGEAEGEDRIEFEEYYEDFEKLNNFIIEDYDANRKLTKSHYYQYYDVDTNKGSIGVSIPDNDDSDDFKMLSLKVNFDLKKSIKKLKGYASNFDTIYATDSRVDYEMGDILVYMRDGSVPTYMSEPDEDDSGYVIYKLRDNWYFIYSP